MKDFKEAPLILNQSTLEELQKQDDKVSRLSQLKEFYYNGFYSDFELTILKHKPNDCPIVQKYSKLETFQYNSKSVTLNTFYSEHPLREYQKRTANGLKADDFQKIDSLPVLIFIHGLGGQLSQFEPVLQEFRNCADVFGVDLPGFGNSKPNMLKNGKFKLSEYSDQDINKLDTDLANLTLEDYTSESIASLLLAILQTKFPNRKFILIAHSMGTHLAVRLTNLLPENRVESLVLLAPPKLAPMNLPFAMKIALGLFTYVPRLFDLYRYTDRSGGLNSPSVVKFIYPEQDDLLKRVTQFRWNLDTESETFLNYLNGFHLISAEDLVSAATKVINSKNETRILICCGDSDKVTPYGVSLAMKNVLESSQIPVQLEKIEKANHSLFLDRPHYLTGVIYQFVEALGLNINCTWVLQIKAQISGDKWGLKNKEKWDKVVTLSTPMQAAGKPVSPLLGMKTLRQTDSVHNPSVFEESHPEIAAIIDIGSDTPAYDPAAFKRIEYVKFKTESKVTPDNVTIVRFIGKADKLVQKLAAGQFIAVHCHYGQNRTGFFICCYLVEKLGWSVKEALDAFEKAKPPGIRHEHFKNALYLRYGE
ncbi:hypothetical protein OGAPHI_005746 [Ogataea philodendri]|uniref:Tyrosine specific protein phosphatases domain-containing protein n=1 Tax=Ogataea philodendri TaxID=1378263 RepID=A0A9P8T1T9_9ASCO|nr:uncharacterized protein OGAPHI_005746 [Ogataea philodendri]KAH3662494.1 hypothetical protein OGAPHI_005746 [Ogataea philodendri]